MYTINVKESTYKNRTWIAKIEGKRYNDKFYLDRQWVKPANNKMIKGCCYDVYILDDGMYEVLENSKFRYIYVDCGRAKFVNKDYVIGMVAEVLEV